MTERGNIIRKLAHPGFIGVLILFLSWLIFGLKYQSDDLGMIFLVTGMYTPAEGVEYLIFTHVLIGKVLRTLYTYLPSIDHYPLYLCSVLVLCAFLSAQYGFTRAKAQYGMFLLIWTSFLLTFGPSLQFTRISMVAGSIACFCFLQDVLKGRASRRRTLFYLSVFSLSAFMRYHSALATLALAMPAFAYVFLIEKKYRQVLGFVLAGACIVILSRASNDWLYSFDQDWSEFLEYTRTRGKLHGSPMATRSGPNDKLFDAALSEVGWERTDFSAFSHWMFIDRDRFTLEHFRKFTQIREEQLQGSPLRRPRLPQKNLELAFVAVLPVVLFLLTCRFSLLQFSTLVAVFAVHLLALLYITLFQRAYIPDRVSDSIFFSCFLLSVPLLYHFAKDSIRKHWTTLVLYSVSMALITGILAYGLHREREYTKTTREMKAALVQALHELHALPDESVFVSIGASWPMRWDKIPPFGFTRLPHINLFSLGWRLHSPWFNEGMERLGIEDLLTAIATRPHTYLLADERAISRLKRILAHHRNLDVRFEAVPELPSVYRAVSSEKLKS